MKREIEFGDYISKRYLGVEVIARVVTTIKPFVLVPYTAGMDIGKGIGCNILGNEKELSKWTICIPPHQNTTGRP